MATLSSVSLTCLATSSLRWALMIEMTSCLYGHINTIIPTSLSFLHTVPVLLSPMFIYSSPYRLRFCDFSPSPELLVFCFTMEFSDDHVFYFLSYHPRRLLLGSSMAMTRISVLRIWFVELKTCLAFIDFCFCFCSLIALCSVRMFVEKNHDEEKSQLKNWKHYQQRKERNTGHSCRHSWQARAKEESRHKRRHFTLHNSD